MCAASQLPNHGEQLCRMTGHNPPDITPSSEPPVRAVLNQGVMSGGLHPPILKFSFQNPISCNRKRHRILCSNSTGGLVMSRQFRPALPLMGGSHPWGLCPGRFMSANRCVVVSGGPPTFSSEDGLKPGFHYPSSRAINSACELRQGQRNRQREHSPHLSTRSQAVDLLTVTPAANVQEDLYCTSNVKSRRLHCATCTSQETAFLCVAAFHHCFS